MDIRRRHLTRALALATLAAPLAAVAQSPQAGRDYSTLNPAQPVERADRIEALEFFWYGCIHCYNLQPHIEPWARKLPADVEFKRVPAIFNERWARDAAIYYALEALALLEKLHRTLFDSIHQDRLRTDQPEAFNAWLQKHGIEPKKFDDAYRSFGVQSRVRRASQLTVAYRIEGTPSLAVHGRYTVSPEQGRSFPGMLQTADRLIEQARRDLPRK